MHPTHIPLKGKSKSTIFRLCCDFWPCSGLLCNCHNTWMCTVNYRIQMLKELNCIKIFMSAIFVWHPLSCLFAIVQIKHRCHCIYTQSINVKLANPEQCIGNEEISHLIFTVIKYLSTPIWMLSKTLIWMLIKTCSIKFT